MEFKFSSNRVSIELEEIILRDDNFYTGISETMLFKVYLFLHIESKWNFYLPSTDIKPIEFIQVPLIQDEPEILNLPNNKIS